MYISSRLGHLITALTMLALLVGGQFSTAAMADSTALYEQPYIDTSSGPWGPIGANAEIADDFTIPAGTGWSITDFTWYTTYTWSDDYHVSFYNSDSSGQLPGALIQRFDLVPTSYVQEGKSVFAIQFHLPTQFVLPTGHYWVSMSVSSEDEDLNTAVTHNKNGAPAQSRSSQHGWEARAVGLDATFRLSGTVDTTPPVVSCDANPPLLLNQANATISATVTDPESGVDISVVTAPVATGTLGTQNIQLTGTNRAGLVTTVSCWTSVVYKFTGLLEPLNGKGPKEVKAGTLIPFKYRLTDANDVPITDPKNLDTIAANLTPLNCRGLPVQLPKFDGEEGLYDLGNGYWQYNWLTLSTYAGECRTMVLTLRDTTTHSIRFTFK